MIRIQNNKKKTATTTTKIKKKTQKCFSSFNEVQASKMQMSIMLFVCLKKGVYAKHKTNQKYKPFYKIYPLKSIKAFIYFIGNTIF